MSIVPKALYHSDCFVVLERMTSEYVELVYMDPPWYTDEGYVASSWHEDNEDMSNGDRELRHKHRKQEAEERFQSYLDFLWRTLQQLHRVLKPEGSLYFHVDPRLSGYVRLLIDRVFERNNFVTEIILPYRRLSKLSKPGPEHSTILVYGKTAKYTLYPPMRKLTQAEIQESFRHRDKIGRFRLSDLTSPFRSPQFVYRWKGVLPPTGRSWRYTQEQMETLESQGLIHIASSGIPFLKTYMQDAPEKDVGNIWNDILLRPLQPERAHFIGQQTISLLSRVIQMSSNVGDIILDPFCGSGTSLVAAEELGRRWIGCDIQEDAFAISLNRLSNIDVSPDNQKMVFGTQADLEAKYPVVFQAYSPLYEFMGKPTPRLRFILDEVLPIEESRSYEFKEVTSKNPVATIKDTADVYAVAFLNSEGGSIYWGVRDNRTTVGVTLSDADRDEIRRVVGDKLTGIQPSISPTAYRINFHPVINSGRIVEDLFVVELIVPQSNSTDLFFTSKNEAYVRLDGGKKRLNGLEIQREILKRNNIS